MALSEPQTAPLQSIDWEAFTLSRKSRPPKLSRWNMRRHSLDDDMKYLLKGIRSRLLPETTLFHGVVSKEHLAEDSPFREALGPEHLFCLDEFSMQAARMIKEVEAAEKHPFRKGYPLTEGFPQNLFAVRKPDTYKECFFVSVLYTQPEMVRRGPWHVSITEPDHWMSCGSYNLFLKAPLNV